MIINFPTSDLLQLFRYSFEKVTLSYHPATTITTVSNNN